MRENVPKIREEGLLHKHPRKRWVASRDYLYLAPTPHEAHYWVWAADVSLDEDEITILRIPTNVLTPEMLEEIKEVDEVDELYSEWLYKGDVGPEDIQILANGRWRNLVEARTPSRRKRIKAKGRNRIVRELKGLPNVEEIYLFGSRARNEHRPDSDYDVLVVMRPGMDEMEETQKVLHALPWPKYDVKVIGTDTAMSRMVLVEDLHPSTEEGTWMSSEAFGDAILLWRRTN
jgi:predicted nucleotidyltransferase